MGDEKQYAHGEAFCHMTYRCEECGGTFSVWNSRDGVTPFMAPCSAPARPGCLGLAQHIDWKADRCEPDYVPAYGDLVWIDMPKVIAEVLASMRLRASEGTPYARVRGSDDWKQTHAGLVEDFTQDGSPYLLRTTPGRPLARKGAFRG